MMDTVIQPNFRMLVICIVLRHHYSFAICTFLRDELAGITTVIIGRALLERICGELAGVWRGGH